ncbi:predicted protein [Sclerotinia sclerotiorum 1980 UF-70]|uniref:Uncharacterized protein n=1 Tax=Sclerotinia sclerotiorum (strain ATCC 18683 / 1980 / Ss-1) TaxID=665079 RepID=A7EI91_SCLS1|nr:predicted protein [Sclerotinia sclerotiorum 1980 UF-70]EDO02557.1 predicted protein [Sclerotinia sclerotiorum 1980 UF-70]
MDIQNSSRPCFPKLSLGNTVFGISTEKFSSSDDTNSMLAEEWHEHFLKITLPRGQVDDLASIPRIRILQAHLYTNISPQIPRSTRPNQLHIYALLERS